MPGRILIADDRFASRLMLSALFGGAYYDILQVDRSDSVLPTARAERPGAIVISDWIAGEGARGLCDALRRDPATSDILRIVVTDRIDHGRNATLIDAGADDVIARSCPDEEFLARMTRLLQHKSQLAELQLRDVAPRPSGLAEFDAPFHGPGRIGLLSSRPEAQAWLTDLHKTLRREISAKPDLLRGESELPSGTDVLLIDSETLGTDSTLRRVAQTMRLSEARRPQVIVLSDPNTPSLARRALEMGAHGILHTPFDPDEATARIRLHLQRRTELTRLRARLRNGLRSALLDPLTGLYNRRYALPRLDQLIQEVRADQSPAALIMADLDHFKWINDTHGHSAGDTVLAAIANVIRSQIDGMGFAARIGGEEFLLALPSAGKLAALTLARRIKAEVEGMVTKAPAGREDLKVTLSIGVAIITPDALIPGSTASKETARFMAQADAALYEAKQKGRNRICGDVDIVTRGGVSPGKLALRG